MSLAQDSVWQGGRWSRYSCWNCQLSIILCTMVLWGIRQVRPPDGDSFFVCVFLCVCVVLFCLHCVVHMCVYVHVCDCVSEGERWCQDKFFSTFQLVLWDRVFQWNLPLSSLANVTSHLLGNALSSVSWGQNYRQASTCTSHLHGFWSVLHSSCLNNKHSNSSGISPARQTEHLNHRNDYR